MRLPPLSLAHAGLAALALLGVGALGLWLPAGPAVGALCGVVAGAVAVLWVARRRDDADDAAETMGSGQHRVLEMIAEGAPLEEVLTSLARLVEAQHEGMLCSVLLLDDDGVHARHAAAPSLPAAYTTAVDGIAIGPGVGSCGTAMHRREPVIVADIQSDPLWDNFRPLAVAHGLRACWSTPILSHAGTVLGSFAMYYRAPRAPGSAELRLIAQAGHLAGIAIERRRAEAALKRQKDFLDNLVRHLPVAVFVKDARRDFRYEFQNHVAADLFAQSDEEILGRTDGELYNPERAAFFRAKDEEAMSTGRAVDIPEEPYRGRQGDARWLHTIKVPLFDDVGRPAHLLGIAEDITERKRAEEELRHSHAVLKAIIEGTPDSVFLKDREGRYILINTAGARLVGRSVEEVVGRTTAEVFPTETATALSNHDREVMAAGVPQTHEETVMVAGAPRVYLTTKAPYRDFRGEVCGVIGVARDVTEHKRLEERYRQVLKMEAVGQLAGGIAHDFNNLLTAIVGYAEMARAALPPWDQCRPLLDELLKAASRAAGLTDQLLAFSRKQVLRPTRVDLNRVVANMEDMVRRLIGANIRLTADLAPSLWPVLADPVQIEQVILNLAVNARDAMPRGGQLTVATANITREAPPGASSDTDLAELVPEGPLGPCVRLTVADTGSGMPEEVKAHLFEPFFTTKGVGRGTGLGLATVYGIVQQSGGRIEVESEVGRGARFTIDLPAAEGSNEEASRTERPAPAAADQPVASETVLVAEDEEGVRGMVRAVLRQRGYTVLEACDGREALTLMRRHEGPIHLVLTDVVMPEVGGPELAAVVARERPEVQVLYMSGYADNQLAPIRDAERRGRLLRKPFDPGKLVRAVREALGR